MKCKMSRDNFKGTKQVLYPIFMIPSALLMQPFCQMNQNREKKANIGMRGSQAAKFSNQGTRASEVYGTVRMLLTLFYRPRSGEVRVRVDIYSKRNNTKIDMIWNRFDWKFCNWKFLFSVFNTVVFTNHERPRAEKDFCF